MPPQHQEQPPALPTPPRTANATSTLAKTNGGLKINPPKPPLGAGGGSGSSPGWDPPRRTPVPQQPKTDQPKKPETAEKNEDGRASEAKLFETNGLFCGTVRGGCVRGGGRRALGSPPAAAGDIGARRDGEVLGGIPVPPGQCIGHKVQQSFSGPPHAVRPPQRGGAQVGPAAPRRGTQRFRRRRGEDSAAFSPWGCGVGGSSVRGGARGGRQQGGCRTAGWGLTRREPAPSPPRCCRSRRPRCPRSPCPPRPAPCPARCRVPSACTHTR